jgi:hypothetical protein
MNLNILGGPLFMPLNGTWYLYGINSIFMTDDSSPPRCENDLPAYFTRIPKYLKWIHGNME